MPKRTLFQDVGDTIPLTLRKVTGRFEQVAEVSESADPISFDGRASVIHSSSLSSTFRLVQGSESNHVSCE
jgi:hypothetical protein